ncbi:MAG TPA: Rid family detoxifying hydrolase [bacterium]|nr:Rid family detoxifying hydrolase [bacterium]
MKSIGKNVRAPKPIGPYSSAVRAGSLLFVSGQIPVDPATGAVVGGGITAQAGRVLDNIRLILEDNGLTMASVVKTTLYVKDLGQFGAVNQVYGEYFQKEHPARVTVEVSRLPKDVDIEIDAIAVFE